MCKILIKCEKNKGKAEELRSMGFVDVEFSNGVLYGIVVVVAAVEKIIRDKMSTFDIYFAFVSDEEIGEGAKRLDYEKYGFAR